MRKFEWKSDSDEANMVLNIGAYLEQLHFVHPILVPIVAFAPCFHLNPDTNATI